MNPNRRTAITVGLLFIIGTVSGVLSGVFTGAMFSDPDYLIKISENETQLILGALLVFVMGFALAMVPVVLFPVFKKYNEALALGAVVFRGALEAVTYIAIVTGWLVLLTLSREYVKADVSDIVYFNFLGTLVLGAVDWINPILAIVFSLGALMIYYLFYYSKLIPRWLSGWGLIGAILYLAVPLFELFGSDIEFLMVPLAIQEMVLALWLIFKGFKPNETTS